MEKLILFTEVYVFIFCILNVIKNSYNFFRVMRLKEGQVSDGILSTVLFGLSLSYIITMLIIGF